MAIFNGKISADKIENETNSITSGSAVLTGTAKVNPNQALMV